MVGRCGARIFEVVTKHFRCPGLRAERDVPALVEGHETGGAAKIQRRARADMDGEHGRDRNQHDGSDQCDAALPHPGTSMSRRSPPKSVRTIVISTASGRV